MSLVKSLINFLKKKDTSEELAAPEGICPNCWGREEYGGHFYERVKQENLNVHSKESNVGWINAYANKHLAGIALKRTGKGEELICQSCKVSYTHSDKHTES
jgi:hypothetical protein